MLRHDTGILCAPTAFGKTVTAAALIARRGVNTLVLVHRTELLKQWQERLHAFLGAGKGVIGTIGGGKSKPTGKIDIAVMQSLSRQGETSELVENYGQVIVDECHHLSAFSFEAILKRARAKYVLGLTATPIRRDGRQPIIFMQCGPIRHTASKPAGAPQTLEVIPRYLAARIDLPADAAIQDVFRHVADDAGRTTAIADEVANAFAQGHKVLVLTERTEHLDAIGTALAGRVPTLFTLHGRMSKKQRAALISDLDDTLVLAMPISWKGTLQQYAGRLHREHADKTRVRIIDFVDAGHPALLRMWERRKRGYQAMGYRITPTGISDNPDFEMGLPGEAGIGQRESGQQVAFKLHLR
jgi:superfamily II DNA or RNA helicase